MKFCPAEGGRVEVFLLHQPNGVCRKITDNGGGVPPGDEEVIFEKFHRTGTAADGNPQSTGLGLSISRHIIEYHNGRIWADPETPVGARFIFFIPFGVNPGLFPACLSSPILIKTIDFVSNQN